MNEAGGSPSYEKVKSVAAHDADAVPDTPDEQTVKGEKAHDKAQRKAKTAAVRAEEAEAEHVAALNERIHVLQEKLNSREEELRELLPRNAELEQARSNATLNGGLSLTAVAVGGLLASISSLLPMPFNYISGSFGAAMLIWGLALSWTTHRFGWPPEKR